MKKGLYLNLYLFFIFSSLVLSLPLKPIITQVVFTGNRSVKSKELINLIYTTRGSETDSTRLEQDLFRIINYYEIKGIFFTKVHYSIKTIKNTSAVTFAIQEGTPFFIRQVSVSGNRNTKLDFIKHQLGFYLPALPSRSNLTHAHKNLLKTGLFSEIKFRPVVVDSTPDYIKLEVRVKERLARSYMAGTGIDSEDGFRLIGEWQHKNLFGSAQRIGFNLLTSFQYDNGIYNKRNFVDVSYSQPQLFDLPGLSSSLDLFADLDKPLSVNYGVNRLGFKISLDETVGDRWDFQQALKIEKIELFNIPQDQSSRSLQQSLGLYVTRSISQTIDYDSRVNLVDPSVGNQFKIFGQYAGGFLGGDNSFYKGTISVSHFVPIFWSNIFAVRTSFGRIQKFGKTLFVPPYEKYFLGGANTIRGFHERSLGPQDSLGGVTGGKIMLFQNLSIRKFLSESWGLVLFLDYGSVWDDFQNIKIQNLAVGTGMGVRWKTAFGLIRIDVGYPVQSGDKKIKLHFGFGHVF